MKLKEYIQILSTFNPEVEVLRKSRKKYGISCLVELKKNEIFSPHQHFKYDEKTGKETLVDSYVV